MGVRLGDRKLDSLVCADRPAEHHPFSRVIGCPFDKPAAVADGLGGDQNPLRIPPVDDVTESLAFLSDQVLHRNLHILEEDRVRVMVDHDIQGLDFQVSFAVA